VRAIIMFFLPPVTDVFYFDKEAAQTLLAGANPYYHTFTTIPASMETPGAAGVFAYLPFTLLYMVPFYLMGDIRLGFVLADVVIGLLLSLQGGKWCLLASVFYLMIPFTIVLSTIYVNNLLVAALFLSVFAALEKRGRTTAGSVSLGVAMATNQLTWLVIPFAAYWYLKSGRRTSLVVMLLVAVVIIAPFLAWSPSGFLYSTLAFQFSRPALALVSKASPLGYNVNPSLDEVFLFFFHVGVPALLRIALTLVLLPLFLAGMKGFRNFALRSSLFATVAIFVLPNDFFWSYAELPLVTFLIFIASREISDFVRNH
jgi:hypothetical protein